MVGFHPGDLLTLYTDGITEAPSADGREFTGARLLDAVKTLRSRHSSEIISGILEMVGRFSGLSRFPDDISLVVVKRVPPEAT